MPKIVQDMVEELLRLGVTEDSVLLEQVACKLEERYKDGLLDTNLSRMGVATTDELMLAIKYSKIQYKNNLACAN